MSLVDKKLVESLIAFKRSEYDKVVTLSQQVLELEPTNLTALNRLGSALYALRDYEKAAQVWEKAHELETDENRRTLIKRFIDRANERVKAKEGTKTQAPEPAPAPAEGEPAPTP